MSAARILAFCAAIVVLVTTGHAEARRRGHINVNLNQASLVSALTLLAEAANVSLVIGDDVSGTVSVRLRNVDPVDAMVAIAEARGAHLRFENGIVIVSKK